MDPLIFHNDRILPVRESHLSPGQMGLLMGWGVFTTLRIYDGLPFAFDRHWARMTTDAKRLAITLGYDRPTVKEAIIKLAARNQRREAMARVSFVKNRGGLWAEDLGGPDTDLLIFMRELATWPVTSRLLLVRDAIYSAGRLAGAKMLSWVQNAGTLERAHTEGFDDALLMNEQGQLAECTSANIFLVCDGKVLTSPLTSGCLPGVTRDVLLEVIPAAGYELSQEDLTLRDLASAQEVFITSTTRGVAAVSFVHPDWSFEAPGKITLALQSAFRGYVESQLSTVRGEGVIRGDG